MVFVKVTVSRTSLVIKNGNLTFKLTNTSINERFTVSDAGFVDQVTGRQIIGALPGVVGSIQANEAIKLIQGSQDTLSGKLLLIDLLKGSFQTMNFIN